MTTAFIRPSDAGPPATYTDLSRQIEQSLAREPQDRVRCVRVFDDFYRCNWWSPPPARPNDRAMAWSTDSTHHVRQSKFLTATLTDGVLTIREV